MPATLPGPGVPARVRAFRLLTLGHEHGAPPGGTGARRDLLGRRVAVLIAASWWSPSAVALVVNGTSRGSAVSAEPGAARRRRRRPSASSARPPRRPPRQGRHRRPATGVAAARALSERPSAEGDRGAHAPSPGRQAAAKTPSRPRSPARPSELRADADRQAATEAGPDTFRLSLINGSATTCVSGERRELRAEDLLRHRPDLEHRRLLHRGRRRSRRQLRAEDALAWTMALGRPAVPRGVQEPAGGAATGHLLRHRPARRGRSPSSCG